METVATAVVLSCLLVLGTCQPHAPFSDPTITYTPGTGLQFKLRDDSYRMVGFHYSINNPLNGVAAGDHAQDVQAKTGTEWVLTDNTVHMQPGDTVNYWILAIKTTGEGLQITERSWTYVSITMTTTHRPTTTRRPATPEPTSNPPVTAGVAQTAAPGSGGHVGTGGGSSGTGSHSGFITGGSNAGIPLDSNTGSNPNHGSGFGSSTSGTGGGSCNCQNGPGIREGFADDRTCQSFPCLIFEDNFDFINHKVWEHELTAGGGGNWEFQYYTNNRSNSYTRDGVLYIKPTLTSDHYGMEFMEHGKLDMWGGSAADVCTSNMDWGCKREGQPGQIVNPIQSARLRSSRGFNFRYGKVEVEAKLPSGDWLWPAIWMVPRLNVYGKWPASGEIDIMESRGNLNYHDPQGQSLGPDTVGSTLHFGADFWTNRWPTAHKEVSLSSGGTYADDFHKYGVEWDNTSITFTVDRQEILRVAPGPGGFWEFGGLDQTQGHENPWRGATRMAPFDQEFYLILNVAVGGVGFFKDENRNSPSPKPWQDGAGHESDRFWGARNQWYPTWHPDQNNGEDAALQVNYVKVWKTKPDPRP